MGHRYNKTEKLLRDFVSLSQMFCKMPENISFRGDSLPNFFDVLESISLHSPKYQMRLFKDDIQT